MITATFAQQTCRQIYEITEGDDKKTRLEITYILRIRCGFLDWLKMLFMHKKVMREIQMYYENYPEAIMQTATANVFSAFRERKIKDKQETVH